MWDNRKDKGPSGSEAHKRRGKCGFVGVVLDQCWAMRQVVGGSDVVPMSWRLAESLLNPAGKGCCVRSGAGVGLTDIDLGSPDRQT